MPESKVVSLQIPCEELAILIGALEKEIQHAGRNSNPPLATLEKTLASLQAKYQSEGCAKGGKG